MSYVNSSLEPIENAIRAGSISIEQGLQMVDEQIAKADEDIARDEEQIEQTKEAEKRTEDAIDNLKSEEKRLDYERAKAASAADAESKNGSESNASAEQSVADYFEKQRDAVRDKIKTYEVAKEKLVELEHSLEEIRDSDKALRNSLETDKSEMKYRCEAMRGELERMRNEWYLTDRK